MPFKRKLIAAVTGCFLAGQALAAVDYGALHVTHDMVLAIPDDASFNFITLDIDSGATLGFIGLSPDDTLRITASESIVIHGVLDAMPAFGLTLQAPYLQIDGTIRLAEGQLDTRPPGGAIEPWAAGTRLDATGPRELLVRDGGTLTSGGDLTLVAPAIPEARTWTMLLAGLGLTGFAVLRRRTR